MCSRNYSCSTYKKLIKTKISNCEAIITGIAINDYINSNEVLKKYKDTNRTYDDLRVECQVKYEKEQKRLKDKEEQAFDANVLLAKKNGYKGYTQYRRYMTLL
jgi:hypothetical protein